MAFNKGRNGTNTWGGEGETTWDDVQQGYFNMWKDTRQYQPRLLGVFNYHLGAGREYSRGHDHPWADPRSGFGSRGKRPHGRGSTRNIVAFVFSDNDVVED